jgi:hypothetical protein
VSRKAFLALSGLVAWFFGATMFFAPQQMLANVTAGANPTAEGVLQWMAVALFSVGCINVLARNDAGSPALRAVMLGNVILHLLGWATDIYQHLEGFVTAQGLAMGTIVHLVLAGGFLYYLTRRS